MSYKGERGLAQIVAGILGTARGCRRLARGVIVKAGTSLANIVSELLNGYGVNLVKPTPVVLALGCLVTILDFFNYSACPRASQDMSVKLDVLHN